MPIRRTTLKSASVALILLPLLSFSQNPQGGNTTTDKPGSKPGVTKDQTPPAATTGGKAGPPADLGEAWDSLKLDSKIRVKLSLRNANIDNIVAMMMKASHVTIIKDPSLTGSMTVATADPVSLAEAFHVFNTVLKLKGFELTRDKKLLIIAPIKKPAPPAPPPTPPANPPAPPPQPDANPVVKFYPILYASAQQVARAINDVFAPSMPQPGQPFPQPQPNGRPGAGAANVRASYEEFSNSVIVHAPPPEQIEVADLIKQIDKTQQLPEHSKTYQLEYAVATEVVSSVQNVLEANLTKGRGSKDNSNNLFPFFFFGFDNSSQNLVVADARTNSLVVTGTDELLKVADRIIADLDHETPVVSTTFVFPLQNARADAVANLLTAAFGPRSGSQNNTNRTTTITPSNNQFNNSPPGAGNRPGGGQANTGNPDDQNLAVKLQDPNASTGDLLTSVGVTQGFFFGQDGGGGGGGGRRGSNGQTVGHGRNGKVTNIHDLTGQVTAVADANTNSIIIVTPPDNADLVKDVIDQLDKIPKQVMIQTIVVEATLDRSKQFGLEWSFAHQIGNTSSTGKATQGFGLQNASPPLQGFNYALTGGDLTAFFNMMQTDTKFQVLSTPRIFTSNNMEAQINISQSIPYVTSTFQNITGTNSFNYAFQDVGIVLTVTPHITSNGYVTMDVLQTANDLQGYTSFNAPIVNQREAETTVSAKDGETIVLGGMIRDQITSTVNKIPLLGDIPFFGNIFRNTSLDHSKTELLVFLTPRVIRDPAEAKKMKDENQGALSKALQGMIKDNLKQGKTGGKG